MGLTKYIFALYRFANVITIEISYPATATTVVLRQTVNLFPQGKHWKFESFSPDFENLGQVAEFGRRTRLRASYPKWVCGFESHLGHFTNLLKSKLIKMSYKLYVSDVIHADESWNYHNPEDAFGIIKSYNDITHVSFLATDENKFIVDEIERRAKKGLNVPKVLIIRTKGYDTVRNFKVYKERIEEILSVCNYDDVSIITCHDNPVATFFLHQNI